MPHHTTQYRVYYEDTDAGGVVYYANYLRFAERARTEWLRSLGFDHSKLHAEQAILILVRRCEIDYLRPARLDDLLSVQTHLQELGKVRMTMQQKLLCDKVEMARLVVTLVCVDTQGKPTPWPEAIVGKLKAWEKECGQQTI